MTSRRDFSKALAIAFIGVAVMSVMRVGVAAAQDVPILLLGRVEWIAGQVMVIGLEGASSQPVARRPSTSICRKSIRMSTEHW